MTDIDANKLRRLDGGLLLVFRELLREGRASRAAEKLNLSQPAISHALSRLRDLFDDPLFIRRPHGFEPTLRAVALGPQVEQLIALADAALSPEAGFDPNTSRRRFSIAAPEFVTALIGPDLVNRLKADAPGVTFTISHAAEVDAIRGLQRGELDFAVGRFGTPKPGFVVEPLFEDVYAVIARADHPAVRGGLDYQAWLRIGHIFASNPAETGGDRNVDLQMVALARAPNWLTVLLMVAATDGIATVPRRLAERHAARLGLQVLDPPFAPDSISVSAMRRRGAVDAGADWFLNEVRAAAERY